MILLLDPTLIEQDMISDLYKTNVFNIPYSGLVDQRTLKPSQKFNIASCYSNTVEYC